MPKLRAALVALGWCVLGIARPASAQSITLNANGITHSRSGRGSNQLNTQLNIADCTMGDELSFALSVVDPNPADTLQVWAGSSCDLPSSRKSDQGCWRIGDVDLSTTPPQRVRVSVPDLLYGRTKARLPGTGAAMSGSSVPDACSPISDSATAESIDVYFMLLDPEGNAQAVAIWAASYKLIPPLAPSILASGDAQAPIQFNEYSYDLTPGYQYQFFCAPSLGTGTSDAGSLGNTCVAPEGFRAGANADNLQEFACGSTSDATGSPTGSPTGLVNGVSYNVAMIALDTYDNPSVLSNVVCKTPKANPVSSGSDATSQACSFVRAPGGRRSAATVFAAVSLAMYVGRRRRRLQVRPLVPPKAQPLSR